MTPKDFLDALEYLVAHARSGQAPDERTRTSLAGILDWLADRCPYKTPLPRGYSLLWSVKTDKAGETQRFHQLIKAASGAGPGVWIDTANLDQVEARDVRVFAEDIATGFLAELTTYLKTLQ